MVEIEKSEALSEEELIVRARQAQQNAYAPYSKFKVGAAILTETGQVFLGCNIENASFGATVCAERTAVYTAVCKGARKISKIVVVTDDDNPVMPCGICRQVLGEFNPNMEVIAVGKTGVIERTTLKELQPHGFRLKS